MSALQSSQSAESLHLASHPRYILFSFAFSMCCMHLQTFNVTSPPGVSSAFRSDDKVHYASGLTLSADCADRVGDTSRRCRKPYRGLAWHQDSEFESAGMDLLASPDGNNIRSTGSGSPWLSVNSSRRRNPWCLVEAVGLEMSCRTRGTWTC